MDFVLKGISEVYSGGAICDLFSGSASLAGAIGQQCTVHSNDIQSYSAILSKFYSCGYMGPGFPDTAELLDKAEAIAKKNARSLGLRIDYNSIHSLDEFNKVERQQQKLLQRRFSRDWHLFVKNYSGTWWTAEQCIWIDAFRQVAEEYKNEPCYTAILASLMYAMAYTSQGTGHYAQFRDAKTESSMSDISIYRKRSVAKYFERKFNDVIDWLPTTRPKLKHTSTALDFDACLTAFQGGTVYADPPYCFVHYSRFYHALETLVLYDYPNLQVQRGSVVKGRYREIRHQSPFCIKTQVKDAFRRLFEGVRRSDSSLAMSYSNTGMITITDLEELAAEIFPDRTLELLLTDHKHMTLGRQKDRHRDVSECLLLVK